MSEENRRETALLRQSSNGLVQIENILGITQKILNGVSNKGFQFDYKTVEINGVIYLAENLKETHFRNGDSIIEAKTDEHWKHCGENEIPAYCYYNNDINNNLMGKLYNYYCVIDKRGLFPDGWIIPNSFPMKDIITDVKYVDYPTGEQINEFNALPCGWREPDGRFIGIEDVFNMYCKKSDAKYHENIISDVFVAQILHDESVRKKIPTVKIYTLFNINVDSTDDTLGAGHVLRCMKTT